MSGDRRRRGHRPGDGDRDGSAGSTRRRVGDLDEAGGREAALLVEEAGAEALFVRIDAREPGDLRAMVDAAFYRFGGRDVLHNNVGVLEANFTDQLTVDVLPEDVWETVYQINLRSYSLTTKYAAPHLKASPNGPAIVNTASVSGLVTYPMGPAYAATKGAVIQLA